MPDKQTNDGANRAFTHGSSGSTADMASDPQKALAEHRHVETSPVRGDGLRILARALERPAEPAVRGRVVGLQPDRFAVFSDRILGLSGVEIRGRETESHHRILRHDLDDLLELGDAIVVRHPSIIVRDGGG